MQCGLAIDTMRHWNKTTLLSEEQLRSTYTMYIYIVHVGVVNTAENHTPNKIMDGLVWEYVHVRVAKGH